MKPVVAKMPVPTMFGDHQRGGAEEAELTKQPRAGNLWLCQGHSRPKVIVDDGAAVYPLRGGLAAGVF